MKVYVDCGYYAGVAYRKYAPDADVSYAFEPNLTLDVPDFVIRKAVWVEDGEVSFRVAGREDAAHIPSETEEGDMVTVPSINFSKFLTKFPDHSVVCNMDIEGAEYPVLRKLIDEGTIDKIKFLDIEFHHRLLMDYTKEDSQRLLDEIEKRGIKVNIKVPFE